MTSSSFFVVESETLFLSTPSLKHSLPYLRMRIILTVANESCGDAYRVHAKIFRKG
jgi:hypothetical protein